MINMAKTTYEMDLRINMGLIVRPGDTLLITFPDRLSDSDVARIKAKVMGLIPGLCDVVVFGANASLAVYRPDGESEQ